MLWGFKAKVWSPEQCVAVQALVVGRKGDAFLAGARDGAEWGCSVCWSGRNWGARLFCPKCLQNGIWTPQTGEQLTRSLEAHAAHVAKQAAAEVAKRARKVLAHRLLIIVPTPRSSPCLAGLAGSALVWTASAMASAVA